MKAAYIGIDLAFAKQKRLPISICSWEDGKLVPSLLRRLPVEPPRGSRIPVVGIERVEDKLTRVMDVLEYI